MYLPRGLRLARRTGTARPEWSARGEFAWRLSRPCVPRELFRRWACWTALGSYLEEWIRAALPIRLLWRLCAACGGLPRRQRDAGAWSKRLCVSSRQPGAAGSQALSGALFVALCWPFCRQSLWACWHRWHGRGLALLAGQTRSLWAGRGARQCCAPADGREASRDWSRAKRRLRTAARTGFRPLLAAYTFADMSTLDSLSRLLRNEYGSAALGCIGCPETGGMLLF